MIASHAAMRSANVADLDLQKHLANERKAQIARAIEVAGGDKVRAADLLGVSRATFYRELKRL